MQRGRHLFLALILTLVAGTAWAYQPMIHKILIDSTSSVSDADFAKENLAVAAFVELLYQRSLTHPGQAAEWVSVSWFGGPNEYTSTIFINCSDVNRIRLLETMLVSMSHPKYGSTAIYSSLLYGTIETIKHDNSLPYDYFKDIILITDGQNNSSSQEHISAINSAFPNRSIFLFVVGVGTSIDLSPFKAIATNTINIGNFDALAAVLAVISDSL